MSREQLDMAVPISVDAASEYYRQNMVNILNSLSSSTIDSIESEKSHELENHCSSSTSSDSDLEENYEMKNKIPTKIQNENIHNTRKPCNLEEIGSDSDNNLQRELRNINSVAINNSSDVHIGNKTFFNGPVTIKHIVLNNDKTIKSCDDVGAVNEGFEGSHHTLSPEHKNNHTEKCKQEDGNNEVHRKNEQNNKFDRKFFTKRKFLVLMGILLVLLTFCLLLVILLPDFRDDANEFDDLQILSRNEWKAQAANGTITDLVLPLKRIIICHTVTTKCETKDECIKAVQSIQKLHFSKEFGFYDIGYNFLIGGDGIVYEGRGWLKQGAHTSGYNQGSLGVAYIGNFVSVRPKDKQIAAGFKLFAEGVKFGFISEDYVIYGASQLRTTESPGGAFLNIIKTWPHAYHDPDDNIQALNQT